MTSTNARRAHATDTPGKMRAWRSGARWSAFLIGLSLLVALLAGCGAGTPSVAAPRATPTATRLPSAIYVALGASDAVGVGATNPNTQGYIPVLISRLPADAYELNLGVSGYRIHDALVNKLPTAIATRPTLVTIWLAGNDFRGCTPLAAYLGDLNTLLDQLRAQTKAQVFIANLPDMSLLPAMRPGSNGLGECHAAESAAQMRTSVQQWNGAIAGAVSAHGDTLIDLFQSQLASHPEYISGDGFHPTSAGYLQIANLFWAQIQARHAVPAA